MALRAHRFVSRPAFATATASRNLLRAGQIDRNVPGAAYNARSAVGVGVASDCLEQKKKFFGKHGGSPVTKYLANNHGKLRRVVVAACDPVHIWNAVF
jgi:hypothetical protein